jgi:uncharacterized protein YdeI (YjbR/CyaY-like superfamily)
MAARKEPEPTYFESAAAFGKWLRSHHASDAELWVGFWKRDTGEPTLTWPESVQEALCYGWIDGIRKRVDEARYKIRFTPRKPGSIWSAVNLRHVEALIAQKRMQPAGMKAYEARTAERSVVYAYEREHAEFDAAAQKRFKADRAAWKFFEAQPPSYRRVATWWVISAKKEETRAKRLERLIADSAAGRRLA